MSRHQFEDASSALLERASRLLRPHPSAADRVSAHESDGTVGRHPLTCLTQLTGVGLSFQDGIEYSVLKRGEILTSSARRTSPCALHVARDVSPPLRGRDKRSVRKDDEDPLASSPFRRPTFQLLARAIRPMAATFKTRSEKI